MIKFDPGQLNQEKFKHFNPSRSIHYICIWECNVRIGTKTDQSLVPHTLDQNLSLFVSCKLSVSYTMEGFLHKTCWTKSYTYMHGVTDGEVRSVLISSVGTKYSQSMIKIHIMAGMQKISENML